MLLGAGFLSGVLLGVVTCGGTSVQPGSNDTLLGARGQCVFPSSCYVVAKSGPLAGQCADCRSRAESCRLRFVPGVTGAPALGENGGGFVPALSDMGVTDAGSAVGPQPTDPTGVCQLYQSPDPGYEAICATAPSICIARGPRCTGGSCVAAGTACGASTALPPQRKPGGGDSELYCPFADDVCCPQSMADGGAMTDAGLADAAHTDAR
jgi:hypothetical protein